MKKNFFSFSPSKKDLLNLKYSLESFESICKIVKKPRRVEDKEEIEERYNQIIDIVQAYEDSLI